MKSEIKRCRDCMFSYDYHEIGYKGNPIMCKCQISQYEKLLSKKACEKFKQKK